MIDIPFVHSFFVYIAYSVQGRGGLEPIPRDLMNEAGYTIDRVIIHHRVRTHTHTHLLYGQFGNAN